MSVIFVGCSSSEFRHLGHIFFTNNNILDALIELNVKKSIGPDKVQPILLQKCATSLSIPLT